MPTPNKHSLIYAYTRLTGRMLWYRPTETEFCYHPHRRLLSCPEERLPDGLALAALAKDHWLGQDPVSTVPAELEIPFKNARQHLLDLAEEFKS